MANNKRLLVSENEADKMIQDILQYSAMKKAMRDEEARILQEKVLAERSKIELLPHQIPPDDSGGKWQTWLLLAGRGAR